MDAILIIVLIAALGLVLLFIYDKRNSIIDFFKNKVARPKKIKLPKIKEPKDISKRKDSDKEVKPDNISYGEFTTTEEFKPVQKEEVFNDEYFGNTIFDEVEEEEDDFDIDKMLAEIEDERRETDIKSYGENILDGPSLPDFNSMSINDLDSLLEDSLDSSSSFGNFKNYLPAYDDDELSGEELGEVIKSLPRSIKILIISDIFNRKY